jgi:Uncharacterized protein conserved in archaea
MDIGMVSDGMFGTRAYENIRTRFPATWISVPFPVAPVVDDLELDIPKCDLYISYARHPDVILGIIEQMQPVILSVIVCDNAQVVCPMFPGAKEILHAEFPDPATAKGSEEEVRKAFQQVRDTIVAWIHNQFPKCTGEGL